MTTPIPVKRNTFWWVIGVIGAHIAAGYYGSFLFMGPHPFFCWGGTAAGFLSLVFVELVYAFYRSMVYEDGELGILIPLWSLPYYLWEKRVKRTPKEEELMRDMPEYIDPLEKEILQASQLAGIVQQSKHESHPEDLNVLITKWPK